MLKGAATAIQRLFPHVVVETPKLTQVGITADGWILCETEDGETRLMEPSTHEIINPSA